LAGGTVRSFGGWLPRVEPFTGLGNKHRVRLLGRVLLSPVRPPGHKKKPKRGIRSYFALPAPNEKVEVRIGDYTTVVTSDRNGYIDFMLELPEDHTLKSGWRTVHYKSLTSGKEAKGSARIIDKHATVGVISDIDDTTMVTMVPDLALAAWNTMFKHTAAREAVEGMAGFYQELDRKYPEAPFIYLSSGAWNTAHTLRRFLAHHGYPPGPLLLTDFGPTRSGWFRSGKQHKESQISWLMKLAPEVKWFMFGDDGQDDPEIYTEACERYPGRVKAIGIRTLSPVQRVLWVRRSSLVPTKGERKDRHTNLPVDAVLEPESSFDVPMIEGPDGEALTAEFKKYGLL